MRRIVCLIFAAIVPVGTVSAIDAFQVQDVRVEGLQRISPGTVFNYLPVKVGDSLTEATAREAIEALFKTGFFEDVRLDRKDNVLVVTVVERPSIDSIKISGTKEIEEKVLVKSLKDLGLSEGQVFNSSLLDKTEQELKRQYFSRGRYGVVIKTTVTPLERNRVAVKIDVNEGEVAKIGGITFVGNQVFDDKELMSKFSLSTPTLFSFLTKSDQYSKQQLSADLESLRNFYQNQGYLDFSILSTQVSITPDKQNIYLTININEGQRFSIRDIKLSGRLIVPEPDLRNLIEIQPGDVFSRHKITTATKAISDRLGNDGYAFANVNAVPDIDRGKGVVGFTFFVDPGNRVYVRKIVFIGNLATNDIVLRREMRQFEGAWFSTEKVQRSRQRLLKLGFLEDVNVETPAVPGSPDQVDIRVTVKERLVNNFSLGIGYSDAEGVLINGSVNMKNFLGTGNEFVLSGNTSKVNRFVNLSHIKPYFTETGISRTVSLSAIRTDAAAANIASYSTDSVAAGISFGFPISEFHTFSSGLNFERVNIELGTAPGAVAKDFVAQYGDTNSDVRLAAGWSWDTLDNSLLPMKGLQHRFSAEATFPGSDLEYYRLSYSFSNYFLLFPQTSLRIKLAGDYGDGFGDTEDMPFYKNYFAGGASTVRGYKSRYLGPKDIGGPDPNLPVGGSKRVLGNLELLFPVPGGTDNKAMRLSVFTDAGMVYGKTETVDFGELRYSAGIAFSWYSPVGPLAISYALPLNEREGDRLEAVQFTLGQSFR